MRCARLTAAVLAIAAAGCFRLTGPEDPPRVDTPALVAVEVRYEQPLGCASAPSPDCGGPVVFNATWLPAGSQFPLQQIPGTNVWRAVAEAVPVNFPPRGEPYRVQIFDPFILATATRGITANRITVGGEFLTGFADVGTLAEAALVYIDAEGRGHNAF